MGRKTRQNKITSPELIAQINPKNIRLMNDFLEYLRSIGKADSTVKAYTSDLYMTFVQIAPIKVNPWSWLSKKIGRAINGEVLNEIADIKKEQRETHDKLEKHIQDDDERDASMHRQRILRFNIELMRGEDFTHECFNDMLLDIDEYERFCETHPGYKNNRAVMAIANIKRVYQDHEENGGFLV